MTRTERAACELALCMLRRDVVTSAGFTPWASDMADVLTALRFGGVEVPAWDGTSKTRWRARLALYLRALLRGTERAWWRVEANGETDWIGGTMPLALAQRLAARHGGSFRAIRPLWQIAAEHAHGAPQSAEWET